MNNSAAGCPWGENCRFAHMKMVNGKVVDENGPVKPGEAAVANESDVISNKPKLAEKKKSSKPL